MTASVSDDSAAAGIDIGRFSRPAVNDTIDCASSPRICRISIIHGNAQVDVSLPSDVPVAALLPELARLLLRHEFNDTGSEIPDDLSSRWSLRRVGGRAVDEGRTLADAGIYDGDLLVLHTEVSVAPPVIYDDVIDAVAAITRREFTSWTSATSRWVGIASMPAAAWSACAWILIGQPDSYRIILSIIGIMGAIAFLCVAVLTSDIADDAALAAASTASAVAAAVVGGYTAIPGDNRGYGWLAGAALAAVVTVLSLRLSSGHPFTHLALLSVAALTSAGTAVHVLWPGSIARAAAITTVIALIIIFSAPRLAILLSRLPLPPVPAAGVFPESIEAPTYSNVSAGISAIGALAIPDAAALELRAKAANGSLAGILFGSAAVAMAAAVIAAIPLDGFYWQGTVFAVLIAATLYFRGRTHADILQVASMIAISAIGLLSVFATMGAAGGIWTVIGLVMAFTCSGAWAYAGVKAQRSEFSPVLRRLGELIEYLVVSATIPLGAWVVGIYSLGRGL